MARRSFFLTFSTFRDNLAILACRLKLWSPFFSSWQAIITVVLGSIPVFLGWYGINKAPVLI